MMMMMMMMMMMYCFDTKWRRQELEREGTDSPLTLPTFPSLSFLSCLISDSVLLSFSITTTQMTHESSHSGSMGTL